MPQNSPSSFISFLDSLDLFLDFGDTKINVLVKLRQLISSVFANAPNNVRLFVLPTAILYSGSTTQFRSVTKTIELKKSDSLDVYGADSIYDDVMDGLNARGYLYSLEGNQLTTNLMFRFFSKALGDSAKMVALSELRALKTQNKVSGLGVGLEMLPSLSAVKPLKGGDNFVYRGLNFHVSEDLNDFVFPNRLDELFGTPTDIINTVTYVGSNNKELVSFKDFVYSESSWIRVLWIPGYSGNYAYSRYVDGALARWESMAKDVAFVDPIPKKYDDLKKGNWAYEDRHFGVIDIETYTDRSGNLIPYAVGSRVGGSGNYIRNKADIKLYYLSDYDGEDNIAKSKLMMVDFLKHILNDNFIGYKFYAHNLGGFDGPLLIKYLADIVGLKIKPLMRNNELYSLDLIMSIESMDSQWLELNKGPRGGLSGIYNKGSVRIILQDSYKLLPLSLSELGKVFAVETQKGEFPHSFVKDDNLTYIGQSPCGNIAEWNLKETCLSYLTADLSCLYEVLINFDKMITYNYSLNFTNYLSIPSLCMATFRSNFLGPDVQIPKTRGKCESDIRKSYRGGIVSLFKPKISKGWLYDINSLYPAAMLNDMPTGKYVQCFRPVLKGFFGFINAKIIAPDGLNKPFLSTTVGGKLVTPLGTWTDWYFSEELKKAEELGYKIEPQEGYRFERGVDIFKEYVNHFYKLKSEAKNSGEKLIYKLMLNSFYGKWGMNQTRIKADIVDEDQYLKILLSHEVKNTWVVSDSSTSNAKLVEYVEEPDIGLADDDSKYFKLMEKIDKDSYTRNTSVGIASAITAYARIAMYDYIADEGVVYSDTDSIFTTKELPEHMVGKELGQMKLEYQFDAALFVRSKIYYTVKDGVYKVVFKGVKRGLATQDDVNKLYLGSSVTFYNNNLRKIPGGGLKEESVKYTVTPPDGSKRSMVRDEEGNWVDTRPINLGQAMIDESKVATSSVEHKPTPTKLAEPRGAAQKGNYSTVHKTKRQQLLETKLSKLLKAADKIKRELANKWGESSCTKTPKKNKKNKKK